MRINQPAADDKDVGINIKAQAKVRAIIGFPLVALMSLYVWIWGNHGVPEVLISGVALSFYCLYISISLFLSIHPKLVTAKQLVNITAILDPLMLSVWLAIMNEAGSLFICFYLFTILGFGFRIGQRPMLICQITSIIGFGIVMWIAPIWQQHPLFGASYLSLLIVVPLYAKLLIKKIQDARAHAESESLAKSELLAKVSHELRTPITGIMASAELLLAESQHEQSTRVTKRANTILSLSKELLVEINDLLDTAKYKANALVLETALFDVRDVMEQLRLTLASAAAAKHVELNISTDDAICDLIQSDAHYLNKVLTNIAGNAVKFTDNGCVDVNCRLREDGGDYYQIRFSIQDTGIGIPRELHEKIFEPFVQASTGTTRQYGGTGLGMSIANDLVSLMGGEIILESEPGKGSLFFFDLKFPKAVKEKIINANLQEVQVVYGKRILVADDNETNLILIKELLEIDGHAVTTAGSGQQTLDILNTEEFDVIFLDYNMGDIEGSKVLQIYQIANVTIPPTFFLTADTTLATSEKLVNTGAKGVLHKPITRDRLRHTLVTTFGSEAIAASLKPTASPIKQIPSIFIDYETIEELKTISRRPEFIADLLGNAIGDIELNCKNLLVAIVADDIDKVRDRAHSLAGVCSAVGALRLAFLARKIMKMTLSELRSTRDLCMSDINETLTPTTGAIKNYLQKATC